MDVDAYLARIGYDGPRMPTLDALRALHHRHMLSVPFENLDIHRGRRIILDPERFVEKIVFAGAAVSVMRTTALSRCCLRRSASM